VKDTNQEELMPSKSEGIPVLQSSENNFCFKTEIFVGGKTS